MSRAPSQATNCGTSPLAAGAPGLEMIPTVLMVGIEEEFLIPFRAKNWTVHDVGLESELVYGGLDALAGGLMQQRLADDPPFADLPLADLELRLDQYNHSPSWLEQANGRRKDERHRNKADVARNERDQFADV